MTRRSFLVGAGATMAVSGGADCVGASEKGNAGRFLFGSCEALDKARILASIGYDFIETGVGGALGPGRDEEWWKRQRDLLRSLPIPLRSCNGFLPGTFRLTGPNADHEPALAYAEKALRRAEEVGVRTIVFGSSDARNVPGDFTTGSRPEVLKGVRQYADFCRELCRRTADLKTVQVVIEPLYPDESNIVNYVWQGVQICRDVGSPRLAQLADFFHMMRGREPSASILDAGPLLKHCHVANARRRYPGERPEDAADLKPYFDALRTIGYAGGLSFECAFGAEPGVEKRYELALETVRAI